MRTKGHTCANPCAKGRAGGCTGACAIDFLGLATEGRKGQACVAETRPSDLTHAKSGDTRG